MFCSAAIVIKEERSQNPSYTFHDFLKNMAMDEPRLQVPSSISEAVKKLAAADDDLRRVCFIMQCTHPIIILSGPKDG